MRYVGAIIMGLVAGVMIHLVVILSLPRFVEQDIWAGLSALADPETPQVLSAPQAGQANPFRLDPEFAYLVCLMDLREGPGVVNGVLPDDFWSVSVLDRNGHSVYGTTNRSGIGQVLQLGLFNAAQTRLLAQRELEITEGLLIVEAPTDDVAVLVRLALPYPSYRSRYEAMLRQISCGHVSTEAANLE